MADPSPYAEGTFADGPDGRTAMFVGGKWVILGSQQMPVPDTDKAAMEKLQTEAQDAQFLDQKGQQFAQRLGAGKKGVATGPAFNVVEIPHVAENINPLRMIASGIDPRLGDMESITNQAWTHMRPAGSGPMRMPEIEGFQKAFPNIENWGNTNGAIVDRLHQDATIASQKLKFIDDYIRGGHGSYADASSAWMQQSRLPPAGPEGRPMQSPMQMAPDAQSPIGAAPQAGAPLPPQLTDQQQSVLNWTPEKGLHP